MENQLIVQLFIFLLFFYCTSLMMTRSQPNYFHIVLFELCGGLVVVDIVVVVLIVEVVNISSSKTP